MESPSWFEDKVFLGDLAADHAGSIHDGVNEWFITGAAAKVAVLLEPVAYFFAGWIWIVVQKHLGSHDKPW